ncbi:hypothetical protein V6N13_101494 [Hibiscus sabdariffa]
MPKCLAQLHIYRCGGGVAERSPKGQQLAEWVCGYPWLLFGLNGTFMEGHVLFRQPRCLPPLFVTVGDGAKAPKLLLLLPCVPMHV